MNSRWSNMLIEIASWLVTFVALYWGMRGLWGTAGLYWFMLGWGAATLSLSLFMPKRYDA